MCFLLLIHSFLFYSFQIHKYYTIDIKNCQLKSIKDIRIYIKNVNKNTKKVTQDEKNKLLFPEVLELIFQKHIIFCITDAK